MIKNKTLSRCFLTFLCIFLTSCALIEPSRQLDLSTLNVEVTELTDNVWLHTTYEDVPPYGLVKSNGLIVKLGQHQAVLVDTAWNDQQTEAIVAWSKHHLGFAPTAAIVTHAHNDKMGGVAALLAEGIPVYAHPMSNQLAPSRGLTPADNDLGFSESGDLVTVIKNLEGLEVFYPGPGHSIENIVVGYSKASLLFGGCFIRPRMSSGLGNTKDGDVDQWAQSIENTANRFPNAQIVIPSHGNPGNREMLGHTISLTQ